MSAYEKDNTTCQTKLHKPQLQGNQKKIAYVRISKQKLRANGNEALKHL